MRIPARPRLPDGDCVFISDVRIVARADAPDIAADMAGMEFAPYRFRNFKTIRVSKPRRSR